jgi:uncharacterized membrane protein
MSKHIRWLFSEVERWTKEDIVTADQAARIRALYPGRPSTVPWGMVVFFGIGAVIAGLGIILLIAYNWHALPKWAKLLKIAGSVAVAHGAGLWLRGRPDWRAHAGEALGLFGTMMFGAGIWLVAQIYNIDEHFPNGFLFWGLGALAMAWALPSVGQAIVATLALVIWNLSELGDFGRALDVAPLLLLAGAGPIAWRTRSTVLATVVLAGTSVLAVAQAGHRAEATGAMIVAISLFATMLALGLGAPQTLLPAPTATVLRFFGWCGFLGCAYVLGFADAAEEFIAHAAGRHDLAPLAVAHLAVWFTLAAAAWGWLGWRASKGERLLVALEEWIVPAVVLFAQGMIVPWLYRDPWLVAVVFNAAFLFVAAMWIDRGCREGRLRPTVVGSVLVALLVFARYFDLFESLATRGFVFLALGGALFAEGFYYRKNRKLEEARRTES